MTRYTRALISVADKTGVVEFAKSLIKLGIELLSTGGTAAELRRGGVAVKDVSELTGFPEIMDGRVKTLHPLIHGALLGRRDQDAAIMSQHGIEPIDLLVVNLYPFEATVARTDSTRAEAIENIDIGGPAMIRAAAKNQKFVAVVIDPRDYDSIISELSTGETSLAHDTRQRLAIKAFAHTANYDSAIFSYLSAAEKPARLTENFSLALKKQSDLRYGENPHQRGALYRLPRAGSGTLISAQQHQGKPLSYNNLADADAALECVKSLPGVACVIVKHANPCGVGIATDSLGAYEKAYATDPTSAFGGIVALNVAVDETLAGTIIERQFLEVIVAPQFTPGAIDAFARKPNIRVLETGPLSPTQAGLRVQHIEGGMLIQDKDIAGLNRETLTIVSDRRPSEQEHDDAVLAWEVARFVKSNAIVYCRNGATIGIGAGQMSRAMSSRIAAWKAEEAGLQVRGAAMASDAFFPFRDGIDIAAEHGISVVIQPGGSMRDEEVIDAANEHGMAMLFTGVRHFRH